MTDPAGDLQAAIRAALKADLNLRDAFGGTVKVYDIPLVNVSPPYITIGGDDVTPILVEGIDLAETHLTVHVWSLTSPPSLSEAKALAPLVLAVLLALPSTPATSVLSVDPVRTNYLIDQDGKTAHAVITVTLTSEPADG